MTWLELIEELKKQPHYLLEREVAVWLNVGRGDELQVDWLVKPAIELTSPYNDGAGVLEWLEHPEYHLSLVTDLDESDARHVAKTCNLTTEE